VFNCQPRAIVLDLKIFCLMITVCSVFNCQP
jgi:hypothetical protein